MRAPGKGRKDMLHSGDDREGDGNACVASFFAQRLGIAQQCLGSTGIDIKRREALKVILEWIGQRIQRVRSAAKKHRDHALEYLAPDKSVRRRVGFECRATQRHVQPGRKSYDAARKLPAQLTEPKRNGNGEIAARTVPRSRYESRVETSFDQTEICGDPVFDLGRERKFGGPPVIGNERSYAQSAGKMPCELAMTICRSHGETSAVGVENDARGIGVLRKCPYSRDSADFI